MFVYLFGSAFVREQRCSRAAVNINFVKIFKFSLSIFNFYVIINLYNSLISAAFEYMDMHSINRFFMIRGAYMKRKTSACLALLLTFVFILNGCSLRVSTIDELIQPPQVQGLNEGIRAALESHIGSLYTLKSPAVGDYRSAFVLSDLDKDGSDEAIAFYQMNNSMSTVHMMLLCHDGESWTMMQDIEGQGNGVYSVHFADFNNDGIEEIVVGWEAYNNKLKRGVSVYSYQKKDAGYLLPLTANLTFSAMAIVDMDEDGSDELLLFSIDSTGYPVEATARLYGYEKNAIELVSEAALDNRVTAYTNVCIQQNIDGNGVAVYVDGTKGESSMITDVVMWDDVGKRLKSVFYDESTHSNLQTLRGLRVPARDVNGDGIVEIAGQEALDSDVDPDYAALIRWSQVQGGSDRLNSLKTIGFSVINFYDGYMVALPVSWVSKLVLSYDEKRRSMILGDWRTGEDNVIIQRNIVNIVAVTRSEWRSHPYSDYTELIKNGDLVYVAKIVCQDTDLPISIEELKENIAIYV